MDSETIDSFDSLYVSPVIEEFELKLEKGFANSIEQFDDDSW